MNLVFKGDLDNIQKLRETGCEQFELYVRDSKDFESSVSGIIAIHMPRVLDNGETINLADSGSLGRKSEEFFRKAVGFCKRNDIPKIVFHPPIIDPRIISNEEAVKIMCRRLEKIYDPSIILCIENVCSWISRAHTKEALFVWAEDFFKIKKEIKIPLKVTFDVEHLMISSIMKIFYQQYREDLLGEKSFSEVKEKFEAELKEYVKNDMSSYCDEKVISELIKLKPHLEHFHVCGSDFKQYYFNPETTAPLIGEHLPINFSGRLFGVEVKDRVNHALWINEIKDMEIDVVMEISPQKGYNFVESLKHGEKHLRGLS